MLFRAQKNPPSQETVNAVQQALAAEHAAEWAYGLASAFLPSSADASIREGETAHRARRDAVERLLRDAGATPVPAEPAYQPPQPVTNQASAAGLLAAAETDAAAAWHGVLERSEPAEESLRRTAMEGLTASAVRTARWRKMAGQTPATTAFPGRQ
ncbi:ferritin-like domain-containing protein [Allokutzneria sp. NRRL B-24872]|uniref:ferritin-like domain-containing protein n=1 Tax=Allokutzneria sp. NRRL B-24872 TaxID=1137961 RepID=UPI000A38FC9B|nr:ferritin-like domain-containing protein [Allokutzneria sp. NRRL B-24872]